MTLLHLSGDYPDPIVPEKTKAIRNLLSLVPEYEHRVMSLNRVTPGLGDIGIGDKSRFSSETFGDAVGQGHLAVRYPGLPRGLFHRRYLHQLADELIRLADGQGIRPRLVQAHKLSVEALAGEKVAAHFGVPLVVSSQGDSDLKIIGLKRDIRGDFRRIWREASLVFPFAPWTGEGLAGLLGPREGPTPVLPVAHAAEKVFAAGSRQEDPPYLLSVFHLDSWKRKNAAGLIRAAALASKRMPGLSLRIAGGGTQGAEAAMAKLVEKEGQGAVTLLGPKSGEEVQALMQGATAFVLPSHRESFGMVFVEALFAGCPVIYPAGAAISGYLPASDWAVALPAADEAALASEMVAMMLKAEARHGALAEAAAGGALDCFTNHTIGQTYRSGLSTIL